MWGRKPILPALFGVIFSLLTYVYVGIRTYADSVDFHTMDLGGFHSGKFVSCGISNEAPQAFPFIDPFYTLRMEVRPESTNNAFGCFENISGKIDRFSGDPDDSIFPRKKIITSDQRRVGL